MPLPQLPKRGQRSYTETHPTFSFMRQWGALFHSGFAACFTGPVVGVFLKQICFVIGATKTETGGMEQ